MKTMREDKLSNSHIEGNLKKMDKQNNKMISFIEGGGHLQRGKESIDCSLFENKLS